MNDLDLIIDVLKQVIWSLPFLCIWGVGIGISINFHSNNKPAANLAITGFSIFILAEILRALLTYWIIASYHNGTGTETSQHSFIGHIIVLLLNLAGWILLLVAFYQLLQPKVNAASH